MILFKHALKRSFSQPVNIIVILLLPIAALFIPNFGYGFPNGLNIYGMINLFSAFLLCKPIVEDRINKVVIRISSTPTSYSTYLGAHLLAYMLILTIQNIIFTLGVYLLWRDIVFNYGFIFCLYFLFNMMTISLSLCWNSLFRSYSLSFGLFSGIGSIMCLISGISMPLHIFPDKIKSFILILPTYWLPYGLDLLYNDKIGSVFIPYVILLIYSGIFLLIGSKRRY